MTTTPTLQEYTNCLCAHNFFSSHHTQEHDYTTTSLQDPTAFIDHDFAYHQAFEDFANLPGTPHSAYAELGDGLENVLGVLDDALWAAESSEVDGVIDALVLEVDGAEQVEWHIHRFEERLPVLRSRYQNDLQKWQGLLKATPEQIRGRTALKFKESWASWDKAFQEERVKESQDAHRAELGVAAKTMDEGSLLIGRIEEWRNLLVRKRKELLRNAGEVPEEVEADQGQQEAGVVEGGDGQPAGVRSDVSAIMMDEDWIISPDEDGEQDLGEGDSSLSTLEAPEEEGPELTAVSSAMETAESRGHTQEQHASASIGQAETVSDEHSAEKKFDKAPASDDVDALAERLADLGTKSK